MKKVSICLTIILSLMINMLAVGYAFAEQPVKDSALQKVEKPKKKVDKDGKIPTKFNLTKPEPKPHPDTAPPVEGNESLDMNEEEVTISIGSGDGENSISFAQFDSGDLIVVLGTITGHAGLFDYSRYQNNIYNYCIWSANITPVDGVQLETAEKYRHYDEAYGLWVPSAAYEKRVGTRDYCSNQLGEPYDILSSKTDQSKWYCSKLGWGGYKYSVGLDLDADGGYWVWPVDLVNDNDTSVFEYSS